MHLIAVADLMSGNFLKLSTYHPKKIKIEYQLKFSVHISGNVSN